MMSMDFLLLRSILAHCAARWQSCMHQGIQQVDAPECAAILPPLEGNNGMNENRMTPAAAGRLRLFHKSLPQRMKLQELLRALGSADGLTALDISGETGALSYHLRRTGGAWTTLAPDEAAAAAIRDLVPDRVFAATDIAFPFDKKSFDAIVVSGSLEGIPADAQWIEECHKALKPDGRLILSVERIKPWTLLRLLRRIFGLTYDRKGLVREGYTETDLFNVLKDGFDVLSMRTYSRFCVEFVDLFVDMGRRHIAARGGAMEPALHRLLRVAALFYWLAFQIDLMLFFFRGYKMIAVAKRRAWLPRKTPVLVDGRSITEAVLSRAAR
jgi:SAM-dependent methyltransferase